MRPFFRKSRLYGPEIILDVLEERIVLDAAVATTSQDSKDNQPATTGHSTQSQTSTDQTATTATSAGQTTTSTTASQPISTQNLSVVLVSNALDQIAAISNAATSGSTVVVLNANTDGLDAVAAKIHDIVVSTGHKVDELAILTHGSDGTIQIGPDNLTSANLEKFTPTLTALSQYLSDHAQIEFYGCSVAAGSAGRNLIDQIASITHAVTFASTDNTGGAGGNWNLEYSSQPGTAMVQVLNTDYLSSTDISLIFPGRAPLDSLSTCNRYDSALTNSDSASVMTTTNSTSYAEVWTFTLTSTTTVTIGLQTAHPELTIGDTGYIDCYLNIYSGATPASNKLVTYNDDWGGATQTPNVNIYDSFISVSLAAGTYSIEATSHPGNYQSHVQDTWQTGAYYFLSSVTLQHSDKPTCTGIADQTVYQNSSATQINLDQSFHDYETSSANLAYTVVGNTNSGLFSSVDITDPTHFTLSYVPYKTGSSDITIRATDSEGLTCDSTFHVTVLPVNQTPTADSLGVNSNFGSAVIITLSGHDLDNYTAGQVSFTWSTPSHGTLTKLDSTPVADGSGNYTQRLTYTPTDANFFGDDTFNYWFTTPSGTWKGFSAAATYTGPNQTYSERAMELTHLNGPTDTTLDLVTAGASGTAIPPTGAEINYYYNGSGYATANPMDTAANDAASDAIAVGDVNHDGYLDVAVHNNGGQDVVYINNAGTGFTRVLLAGSTNTTYLYQTDSGSGAIAMGDVTGDGNADIIVGTATDGGTGSGMLVVYKSLGSGTFDMATAIAKTVGTISALAVGDFNGDGKLDIVVGFKDGTHGPTEYINNGDGTFTAKALPLVSSVVPVTYSLAVGDVDGDGHLDIVAGNYSNNTAAGVDTFYKNDGTNFTAGNIGTSATAGDLTTSIRLADIDRDGHLEVITTNYNTSAVASKYYSYDSTNAKFDLASHTIATAANYWASAIGDVTGDGYLDYVVGVIGGRNVEYTNQGFNTVDSNHATVGIHIEALKNASFSSQYTNWTLVEDGEPNPSASTVQNGTFAVLANGTVINAWTGPGSNALHDYLNNNSQDQYSWFLPLTIGGKDSATAVHLINAPEHSWLSQTFTIPNATGVANITLQWDMAYWNHASTFKAGEQDIAVYVYDVNNTNPTPLWITTTSSPLTVGAMTTYSVNIPTSLLGHTVKLVVENSAMDFFFEYAVDNFRITEITSGSNTVPTITVPTLASVFGPAPAYTADTSFRAGGVPITGGASASMASLDPLASLFASASNTGSTGLTDPNTTTAQTTTTASSQTLTASTTTTDPDTTAVQTTTTTSSQTLTASTTTTDSATTGASVSANEAITINNVDLASTSQTTTTTTTTTSVDLLAAALTPTTTADTTTTASADYGPTGDSIISLADAEHKPAPDFDIHKDLSVVFDDISPLQILSMDIPALPDRQSFPEMSRLAEKLSEGCSMTISMDSISLVSVFG
jgi:hypothetical protein